ncbi:MAG: class I SAM-dependent methyltransferase [Bryobacterales bacterium]|nr:class I SAM-dependent methyltransferase [Bryobacterales bacterium]
MTPLFVLIALFAPQTPHQHHPPRDAKEYAKILEDPARDAWQKPHEVITALKIRPDEVMADIGSGSGYFTRRFAHHAKTVYAVDIDAGLLGMIEKQKIPNIKPVHATPDDPKLPMGAVDTIFICDVLHHIENRPAYYQKLAAALKPGGRIVNIDFYKRPLPVGPPESMKLSEEQVMGEFKAAGFRKTESFDFLPNQYFLVFQR